MAICEFHKNKENPEAGIDISFTSSGKATNQLKESLAGVFKLEGNRKLLRIIESSDRKYPQIKSVLEKLSKIEL